MKTVALKLGFTVSALMGTGTGCGAFGAGAAGMEDVTMDAHDAGTRSDALRAGLSVGIQAVRSEDGSGANVVARMEQLVVSVSAVAAHAVGAGWVVVSDTPAVVDLLKLQEHAEELGFAHLPEGKITQIRLYVADDGLSHAVDRDGTLRPLTIPSGLETGIKLKGPFELGTCENGSAIAILDLEKSILVHGRGNHDDLVLRPTIHRTDYAAVPADICTPPDATPDVPSGSEGGSEGDPGSVDDAPSSGDDPDDTVTCPPGTEGCSGGTTDGADDGAGDSAEDSGAVTDPDEGSTSGDTTGGDTTGGDTTGGDTTGGDTTGDDTTTDDPCAPVLVDGVLINPCGG